MSAKDLLDHILATGDARLFELQSALKGARPTFLEVVSGDGASLWRIYSIRAEVAKEKGEDIKGFEDLLPNLETAQHSKISVIDVITESRGSLVFVDTETEHILGVLSFSRNIDLER
jgi:hypothetical protein